MSSHLVYACARSRIPTKQENLSYSGGQRKKWRAARPLFLQLPLVKRHCKDGGRRHVNFIERKSAHYLQKLAELNYLFFILAATVIPFHASMAADAPFPPRAVGVMVWPKVVTVEEPAKTEVSPQQAKCLLALGDVPRRTKLLPGISKGRVDPRTVEASARIRTWSKPDPREPPFMLHYVEISSPRYQVLGIHSGSPPYGMDILTLRDSAIALPCGLRVGQPMDQFIKALGQPTESGADGEVGYYWEKLLTNVTYINGNIMLRPDSKRVVQEIQWESIDD